MRTQLYIPQASYREQPDSGLLKKTSKETDKYSIVMFLSECFVLFLQLYLVLGMLKPKTKKNEFTSYNIIIPMGTPKH